MNTNKSLGNIKSMPKSEGDILLSEFLYHLLIIKRLKAQ